MNDATVARTRRALRLLLGKENLSDPHKQAALAIARDSAAAWLSSPDIVGIGVGYRTTRGIEDQDPAIVVRVVSKTSAGDIGPTTIPPVLRLPGVAGVIQLDVVQGGIPQAHAVSCGDGVSSEGSINWGTLGFRVMAPAFSRTPLVLTCAHVLDGLPTARIEGLKFPVDTKNGRTPLGTMAHRQLPQPSSPGDPWPNLYEVAFIDPQIDVGDAHAGDFAPVGLRSTEVRLHEPVVLFGAKSGRREGYITELDASCHVESHLGTFGFCGLMLYDAKTSPGDSGAAVMDLQRRVIGLHLAALPEGKAVLMPIAPIARRYRLRVAESNSAEDNQPLMFNSRPLAIDTLARTIWGEARGQPVDGQEAVANVVMNRLHRRRPHWGLTVEAVCRKPKQFSCWNADDPNLPKLTNVDSSDLSFMRCLDIARRAVNGSLADRTHGSTHYHTTGVSPSWSAGHTPAVQIGDHLFFNTVN